jgi:phosphoglycolate phosphatase-like HAD superfamily hydrolase
VNLAIFDVDGTLLDNLASEDACFSLALSEVLGFTALDTDWSSYEHVSDEGVAREAYRREFGVSPSPERIARTIDRFLALLADAHETERLTPVAGAAELLTVLPARGWIPALATGAWGRATRFKLAAADLAVDHLVLATAEDGPDRAGIVQTAWARAVAKQRDREDPSTFRRVVLIGDGVWDIAAAHALGLPCVGRAAGPRAAELRACGAEIVLEDLTQVDAVIAALVGRPL